MKHKHILITVLFIFFSCTLAAAQTRRIEAKKKTGESSGFAMSNPELVFNVGLTACARDIYYTSNGKYLVTVSDDKAVKLWEVETGRELRTLTEHPGRAISYAYSHDKKYLAINYSDGEIQIWEVEIGKCIQTLHEETSDGYSNFFFSPDGRYLVVSSSQSIQDGDYKVYWDKTIKLWDIVTGGWAKTLSWSSDCYIGLVVYSFDGEYLANITGCAIEICKMKTGEFVKILTDESYTVNADSVAISHDSKYLACSYSDGIDHVNGIVKIFEIETAKLTKTLTGHAKKISSVSYTPDGKYLATGSEDSTLKVWDVGSGKCLTTISDIIVGMQGETSIIYSPDGKVLTTLHKDNTIKLWEVASRRCVKILTPKTTGHPALPGDIRSIAYTPDGRCLAVADWEKNIKLLEVETGIGLKTLRSYAGFAGEAKYSPDGAYMVSGMGNGSIKLWKMASGKFKILSGHTDSINDIIYSPDGAYLVTSSDDSTIKLWEVASSKCVKTFIGHTDGVDSIVYSSDGKYITSGSSDNTIKIWEVESGKCIKTLTGHKGSIYSFVYSSDEKYIASVSSDDTIKIWEVKTGKCLKTLESYRGVDICYFDGKYLVSTGKEPLAKIWDVETGKCIKIIDGNENDHPVKCSSDGRYLARAFGDGTIKLYEVKNGECIEKTLSGHTAYIEDIIYSPDGGYLISCSGDNTIKFWELGSSNCVKTLTGHTDTVYSIGYSHDGSYLTSTSYDETMKLWEVKTGKCIQTLNVGYSSFGKIDILYSKNEKYLATLFGGDNIIKLWDMKTGKHINTLHVNIVDGYMIYSPDDKYLTTISKELKFWDASTGELLATTFNLKDDEWLTYTPEGFFAGSEWATKNLVHIVDGMKTVGIDQMYDSLYRPDLVSAKLSGENISPYAQKVNFASLVQTGSAPIVTFLSLEDEVKERNVTIEFAIQNTDGGIGEVNLLLNGKNIRLAENVASKSGETVHFSHTITLQNGKNTVELYAKNAAGKVESLHVSKTLKWQGTVKKPNLYIFTVAINKYRDRRLQLKYAVPDAEFILKGFSSQKKSLYQNIFTHHLFDDNVTRDGLKSSFEKLGDEVQADDVFVFYIAGHGITYDEDGDYYYLPSNFRFTSSEAIQQQGISKNDLTRYLSFIKAGKTLMLMDTCNAGSFLGNNTRGLSEQTAIDRLTRSTGHATIVASSDDQVAMEGYEGHGIFTYILVEGLRGKADTDGDGFITLQELSAYTEEEVPRRSYEKWGYEQTPMRNLRRQDFPIYTSGNR